MTDKDEIEYIKEAAIIFRDKMWTGKNHSTIIGNISSTIPRSEWPVSGPQGFVTSTGRFVDRKEGAQIALAAGQIKAIRNNGTDLYSEDLYEV